MHKKTLFISVLFLFGTYDLLSQTLTGYDGELHYLIPSYTYTLEPIPQSYTSLSPLVTGHEWGEPMTFIFNANPGDEYRISFTIRNSSDGCIPEIDPSFALDALRWSERDMRLDPNILQSIILDSSGTATFNLGVTVSIPADMKRSHTSVIATCVVINARTGDSLTASSSMFVQFFGGLLSFGWDYQMSNLSRGQTYSLTPGAIGNSITPLINGRERGTVSSPYFGAILGANVELRFRLPSFIKSDTDDDNNQIPCTFAPDALKIVETGEYKDPNTPVITTVTSSCLITFDLGITVSIPSDLAPGTYTGQVIFEASYVGNFRNEHRISSPSEAEILYAISVIDDEIPNEFSLQQNYPNPFNSGTKIRFGLPEPANVNLSIFDVLGRKVATLVDELRYAGLHTVDWQADGLTTGLYFYKLTAGNHTEVKKLTLIL